MQQQHNEPSLLGNFRGIPQQSPGQDASETLSQDAQGAPASARSQTPPPPQHNVLFGGTPPLTMNDDSQSGRPLPVGAGGQPYPTGRPHSGMDGVGHLQQQPLHGGLPPHHASGMPLNTSPYPPNMPGAGMYPPPGPSRGSPAPPSVPLPASQIEVFDRMWADQQRAVDELSSSEDFRSHPLPLARIKRIMKQDDDVKTNQMIAAETPAIMCRACEFFILDLTLRAWLHTEENRRRTLQRDDIAAAVQRTDLFDFVIDIVPRTVGGGPPSGNFPREAAHQQAPQGGGGLPQLPAPPSSSSQLQQQHAGQQAWQQQMSQEEWQKHMAASGTHPQDQYYQQMMYAAAAQQHQQQQQQQSAAWAAQARQDVAQHQQQQQQQQQHTGYPPPRPVPGQQTSSSTRDVVGSNSFVYEEQRH